MRKPAKKGAKNPPKVAAQSAVDQAALSAFRDLEAPIRVLERAANVAYLMTMREEGPRDKSEGLALFAVVQVEQLAAELCKQFYRAFEGSRRNHKRAAAPAA
jgi:hypothetical protein